MPCVHRVLGASSSASSTSKTSEVGACWRWAPAIPMPQSGASSRRCGQRDIPVSTLDPDEESMWSAQRSACSIALLPGSFDLVISTEVLEHVRDWRRTVRNFKTVLREHAILIVTTRSPGFEFHGFPLDFWRFEPEDISEIFGDLEIETIERDPDDPPGVFFRARRPAGFTERDLDGYSVYSVVRRRRARSLTRFDVAGAHCLAAGQAVVAHLLPLRARHAIRQAANRCSSQARRRGGRVHVDGPEVSPAALGRPSKPVT